jgi:nitrate reductase cytochrome c-type subunit
MGLLERLKDMVASMNEEEKTEFFSEFEKEKEALQKEEEERYEEAPPVIECTLEQTQEITNTRNQIVAAKLELSRIIIAARETEARAINLVKAKEDELLEKVSQIKQAHLPNPSDHDNFLLELPSTPNEPVKLVKQ